MSESQSQTVARAGSLTTIDAERCPTCNEERFVVLRGNRVACPTCCSTIRSGELYLSAERRDPLQTRRSTIFIVVSIATVLLALWAFRSLTLHR
jgi:hypothetical protein